MNNIQFLFLVLCVIFIFLLYKSLNTDKNYQSYTPQEVNEAVSFRIRECSKTKKTTDCLIAAASEFIKNYKVSDVVSAFDKNEEQPEFFSLCHTTLHFIGRELYKKNGNTQQSLNECTSACFQGCHHGVLEGYLSEKSVSYNNDLALRDEIIKICGQKETYEKKELYNECLHGLGHALMFVADGELPRSLSLCDSLKTQETKEWCYSGVFMENSTSSTNKDHPSKYLKADDPMYPCTILDDKYLDMCYTLQGLYFAELHGDNLQKIIPLCNQVPKEYRSGCFRSIGQRRVGITQDLSKIKEGCTQIGKKEYLEACIQGAVGALSTKYSGNAKLLIEFCSLLSNEIKEDCYRSMKSYLANWVNDPKELNQICLEIPEEEYKQKCMGIQ